MRLTSGRILFHLRGKDGISLHCRTRRRSLSERGLSPFTAVTFAEAYLIAPPTRCRRRDASLSHGCQTWIRIGRPSQLFPLSWFMENKAEGGRPKKIAHHA